MLSISGHSNEFHALWINISPINGSIANKYLNGWTISRLGNTDQAILQAGIYELKYTDTPPIVVINEAVNLAKQYSDDKVKNMINAALDKYYHEEVIDER